MPESSRPSFRLLALVALAACGVFWHLYVTSRLRRDQAFHLRVRLGYGSPGHLHTQSSNSVPAFACNSAFTPSANSGGPEVVLDKDGNLVYHYSVRPGASLYNSTLVGPKVKDDVPEGLVHTALLAHVDEIKDGFVSGWACIPGQSLALAIQVMVYVDGVLVGETGVGREASHPLVQQLCAGGQQSPKRRAGFGFTLQLPDLAPGMHQMRAFARQPFIWTAKQEFVHSPISFMEATSLPGPEEALQRERAASQASLDHLADFVATARAYAAKMRLEAVPMVPQDASVADFDQGMGLIAPGPGPANASSGLALAVLGVNSGLHSWERRNKVRWTWMNVGKARAQQLLDTKLIFYFVIGYSDMHDDPVEASIQEEMRRFNDIIRVNAVDSHANLSEKTLKLFSLLSERFRAHFYFKVDDDVAVNVEALTAYLNERRGQGNLYMGCMKSGAVNTNKRYKYFEPESWRFGESPYRGGATNYMRHASGQIYGLSAPLARYLAANAHMLHRFANEDVTVGAWLVGLEVAHVHQPRFCCSGRDKCSAQVSKDTLCLSYYENACAGICNATRRLEAIYWTCIADPLKTGANGWWKLNKET